MRYTITADNFQPVSLDTFRRATAQWVKHNPSVAPYITADPTDGLAFLAQYYLDDDTYVAGYVLHESGEIGSLWADTEIVRGVAAAAVAHARKIHPAVWLECIAPSATTGLAGLYGALGFAIDAVYAFDPAEGDYTARFAQHHIGYGYYRMIDTRKR